MKITLRVEMDDGEDIEVIKDEDGIRFDAGSSEHIVAQAMKLLDSVVSRVKAALENKKRV